MAGQKEITDASAMTERSGAPLGSFPDRMARWGGVLLLLTATVTAVMVYARVASDTDQGTLLEFLRAVSENQGMYGFFGATRLASGLTLLAGGWFLLRTWIIRDRWATPWVPCLFITSGICTAVSGASAILIAFQADAATASITDVTGIGAVDDLRWLTGKVGFTVAGLALVVAAWYQWRVGGTLRRVAPASVVLGDRRQLVLPVTSISFAGRYGVIIRYGGTVDYRPTNQAIEAETYGRQDTGNGSGQGWDERAFSAQVAEWPIAVAGETGASVAHQARPLRRGVGG